YSYISRDLFNIDYAIVVTSLPYSSFFFFFFYCSDAHRDLHSFPTRRSSDLRGSRIVEIVLPVQMRAFVPDVRCPQRSVLGHLSLDRKSTRLNSSHDQISYAVFCLKKKNKQT